MTEPLSEPRTPPALCVDVFRRITDRLVSRAEDISRFVATGYSFDEWINWEAFLACEAVEGWKCSPRPPYATAGAHGGGGFGDLLVRDAAGEAVFVEIGLAHDYSGDRWAAKLDADARKLEGPFGPGVSPLQLIVCASAEDLLLDPAWLDWLGRAPWWNRSPYLESAAPLPPRGSLLVRGFC